ncbi:MAG TPA: prepilin-type N-terminal cleavage/methylation domain-containing protein [Opitutales bacterium]|mgnify:CR=1 FL=1|nr:prepilin-type N-terminal cleavage/methylation domain-containing protein [Opitutales bacterium]
MRGKAKGFTLVEIMIVVVIIGLLATLAIPAFNRVRHETRKNIITNNLRQVSNAAQQYFMQNGATEVEVGSLLVGSDAYIKALVPIAGEDYSTIGVITQGFTQLSLSVPALGETVYYNQ